MEKMDRKRQYLSMVLTGSSAMAAALMLLFMLTDSSYHHHQEISPIRRLLLQVKSNDSTQLPNVVLQRESSHERVVIMDNGFVQVTLSHPDGDVVGIKYNGVDNVLEVLNEDYNRGYWDVVWNKPGDPISIDRLRGTKFDVVIANEDQLELSFIKTWNVSDGASSAPLIVDKRYILVRGISGFYTYAIFQRLQGFPEIEMDQIRAVYKLQKNKFHYMAISDDRQRIMPMPDDRETGQPLAYPEAVLLTDPTNPELRGEVDDKYQYSCEDKDNKVHGWICNDPSIGFWMITPSDEFRMAGPVKQDLTSHVGPVTLSSLVSTHYAGKEVGMKFEEGEPWKKVFGPMLVYLNSVSTEEDYNRNLWEDAKNQMSIEVNNWPYSFPQSVDFPSSDQRGRVTGQLIVRDRYVQKRYAWAKNAFVGLAAPGEIGSWQKESKGYQFWTQADGHGHFSIDNVRVGDYNLYSWVPGFIGDHKYESNITIEAGGEIKLDLLVYRPPREGPTLWEIGIPDRSAAEFYIPDPYPTLMNRLYNENQDKFRQYGLWERYADLYPDNDLVFNVGLDDYRNDWFFVQVTRNIGNKTYEATTWQIKFQLDRVNRTGNYTLQLALASATDSDLQVRFNNPNVEPAHSSTGRIGKDNAIARHGIHGLYWLYSFNIIGSLLDIGNNVIYLTQSIHIGPFNGIMYDYIRLEGPPPDT